MAKVKLLDPSDQKRRLDRYELIGELAQGGMATVYLARIAGAGGFQRFVAIKRLHPHLASEEEFIEMFLDEARLAAGIHHPHVVPILEVGESEAGYYLVMEYIEGDTLARIVARSLSHGRPVPRPILIRITLDALAGLHAAHELTDAHGTLIELVHRDCSPQNILVGVDGCSRITDFGVARASSRLSNTRTDRLKGKLAYMSPEQARGKPDIDRRSDVFAMGVILWEVLAGRRLFKTESETATLQRVLNDPIPRLSSVLPDLHPAIDDVCARALERDAGRRYQNAAEMADALERAAREAAARSPSDLGVASPREVAGYVQSALGQDIAAQRESVRAWLSQSEQSAPAVKLPPKPAYDVTVKVPLDRPGAAPLIVTPAASPHADTRLELKAPGAIPGAIGAPIEPRAAQGGAAGVPIDARPPCLRRRPAAGQPALPSLGAAADRAGLATEEYDPDAEGETQLMVRGGRSRPPGAPRPVDREIYGRPSGDYQDPTPIAATAITRRVTPPSRAPQILAVVIGLILAGVGFALWSNLRGGPAASPPAPSATSPGSTSQAPAPPASSAPAAPATPPAATTAATTSPPIDTAPPKQPPPLPGSPPHKPTATPPKPKDPAPDPPKPPPPTPKPPAGGDDMANPYR
ncbi:MAG: protein kinase [Byssovorax sp.]